MAFQVSYWTTTHCLFWYIFHIHLLIYKLLVRSLCMQHITPVTGHFLSMYPPAIYLYNPFLCCCTSCCNISFPTNSLTEEDDDKDDPFMMRLRLRITCRVQWWACHVKESWNWTETGLRCLCLGAMRLIHVAETTQEHVRHHVIEHWELLYVKSASSTRMSARLTGDDLAASQWGEKNRGSGWKNGFYG